MRHQGAGPRLRCRVVRRREEVRIESEAVQVFAGCIQHRQRPADFDLADVIASQVAQGRLPIRHPLIAEHLKDGGLYSIAGIKNTVSRPRRIKAMDPELRPVDRIGESSRAHPDRPLGQAN